MSERDPYFPGYYMDDEIFPALPVGYWPNWAYEMKMEGVEDREIIAEMRRRRWAEEK